MLWMTGWHALNVPGPHGHDDRRSKDQRDDMETRVYELRSGRQR